MLRVITSAAFLLSTFVPLEHPAAYADKWHKITGPEGLCVDTDSESIDGDWVAWSFKQCDGGAAPRQAKIDCEQQVWSGEPFHPKSSFSWFERDGASPEWVTEVVPEASSEGMMIEIMCTDWLSTHTLRSASSAAPAPKWNHLEGTFVCVDSNSERFDQDGAYWSFEYSYDPSCANGSSPLRAKAECRHQVFGPDFDPRKPLIWHLYDGSAGWIEQSEQPDSEQYLMVGVECVGWKDSKGSSAG